MIQRNTPPGFEISISASDDGAIEAVYVRVASGEVADTREILEDALLADYDEHGDLLGFEVLARVRIDELVGRVQEARREPFRRFLQDGAPPALLEPAA